MYQNFWPVYYYKSVYMYIYIFFFLAIYIHLLDRNTGFFSTGPDTLAVLGNISATTMNLK